MNDNSYVAGTVYELLGRDLPVVLACIVKQSGSTPRHLGVKMVISSDGKNYGTIGGGSLESDAINQGKEVLERSQSRFVDFDLSNENPDIPEMICGGKVTVMLEYLSATGENVNFFKSLYDTYINRNATTLLTVFDDTDSADPVISHCLVLNDGKLEGNCPLSEEDLEYLLAETRNTSTATSVHFRNWQIVIEPIQKTKTVYCMGAGHVSQSTVRIAAIVGFRVVVIDDRSKFSNTERFPDANEVYVIDDFHKAFEGFHIDNDSFIVIFTRNHMYDHVVLEQALKTDAGYIGMIASRRKRDSIYEALRTQGITEEDLNRVHSPIGLKIGAETPEEIAVSIVAELIQERSRQSI